MHANSRGFRLAFRHALNKKANNANQHGPKKLIRSSWGRLFAALALYLHLTDLMLEFGSNLGAPHTKAVENGLFELRVKGKEGIARVFYCTKIGKRIVMLHVFVKKTQKTPKRELKLAMKRMNEVLHHES